MEDRTGFLEEEPGVRSSTRLKSVLWQVAAFATLAAGLCLSAFSEHFDPTFAMYGFTVCVLASVSEKVVPQFLEMKYGGILAGVVGASRVAAPRARPRTTGGARTRPASRPLVARRRRRT